MSDEGVFQVHRGIWDHDIFAGHAYGEREAWLWLVSAAAWKDCRVRSGGRMIDLNRGQLAFATRFLANKWGWSHTKTVRFLNLLKNETMIGTLATRHETIITICNYNQYQFVPAASETQNGTQNGTETVRKRYKEEEVNKIIIEERKKETRASALSSAEPSDFDAFWIEWPNKVGKPAALKAFNSAVKRGAALWDIQDGLRNYIRDKPPDRPWLNPATFLNQNRWEDQPAQVQNGKTGNIIAASDKLLSIIDSFDAGPRQNDGLCSTTGPPVVRLLSQRRGE